MNNNLSILFSNPHLRYAALLIVALHVAGIWLPQYKVQLDATRQVVTLYAILAAANSAPVSSQPNVVVPTPHGA